MKIPTLFQTPFFHSTCSITSIPKNELLVEQLATDLRARGVRCWFFPESDDIRDVALSFVEIVIEYQDIRLLILSKTTIKDTIIQTRSMPEPQVFRSRASRLVQHALQKEQEEQRIILFVLFLDQEALESPLPWIANLREQGRAIDFTSWEDEEGYQQSLDILYQKLVENEARRTTEQF